MSLLVIRPGMLTTVQDLGRTGLGALGVPPCGAMDPLALEVANRLVGNVPEAAGLELTLLGPELLFERDCRVAFTGAPLECHLEGQKVPAGVAVPVRAGQRLSFGSVARGIRAWLAVSGGLDVPVVLGSRSTFLAAGWGGWEGRALRAGDRLAFGSEGRTGDGRTSEGRTGEGWTGDGRSVGAPFPTARSPGSLEPGLLAEGAAEVLVRVIPGPQEAAFTAAGLATFYGTPYRVSARADRMGVRLEGPSIGHAAPADLLPEGQAPGSIQVPADGLPIVLGADRPATGGYTRIATVISVDLGLIAQARPGDIVRFMPVEVAEARRWWLARKARINSFLAGKL